ncbi:MAG: hypothetical protein VW226_10345 [Rhodospirillaceae bacterium]
MNRKIALLSLSLSLIPVSAVTALAEEILYSRSHGYTLKMNGEQYKVRKGDTLFRIIRQKLNINKDLKTVAQEIVLKNPKSFPTKNRNFMLSGTTLDLTDVTGSENHMRNRNEIFFIR